MKRRIIFTFVLLTVTAFIFTGCSNLFENIINEDLSFKKGDDSLYVEKNVSEISNGLVVIKASEKYKNQISYSPAQSVYFVGQVADEYSDYKVNYKNGTDVALTAKDGPVELRCFANDVNARIEWTLTQTWKYIPEYESKTVTGTDGKEITYQTIKAQTGEKLEEPVSVSYDLQDRGSSSFITANLPFGITVASCKVIADDDHYKSEYKIILSKVYADRALVVAGAQDYSLNKISFDSMTAEYTIDDVRERDNDIKFRFYLAATDKEVNWELKQVAEFVPEVSEYTKEITDPKLGTKDTVTYKYISGQTKKICDNPKTLDFQISETSDYDAHEILAEIPVGITEAYATVISDNGKTSVYKITLQRDLCKGTVTPEEFEQSLANGEALGDYSQLEDLKITVVDEKEDQESSAKLEPSFSPDVTSYTLTVGEEADSISIEALAASEGAVVSEPVVVTKYGEVPAIDGINIALVGGTSKITFTVTDETQVSRTYTIYVEKPADGDTSLKALNITPSVSFENGLSCDKALDQAYKGEEEDVAKNNASAYYNLTLSADSRIDLSKVIFEAEPHSCRTLVSYGISDSATELPSEWSQEFTKADVMSQALTLEDADTDYLAKYLWIKTVSDKYYHKAADGYEDRKRADTTYHKVKLTKAGKLNKKLTVAVIDVTYENEEVKSIWKQVTASKVADEIANKEFGIETITTFADKVEIYFRPLDKDAEITYSISNEEELADRKETRTLEGVLEKITGNCDKFNDGSNECYKLTIGSVDKDSENDLPRGRTTVTILGQKYTFVKPDLKDVSYKFGVGSAKVQWEHYIYLAYGQTDLQMNITTRQQNQKLSVDNDTGCLHTADSSGKSIEPKKESVVEVKRDGEHFPDNPTKWLVSVNDIPEGTTTLKLKVTNEQHSATVTYYIIREANTDTRLKSLSFAGAEPGKFESDWTQEMTGEKYSYVHATKLNVADGLKTLKFEPVNPDAKVTVKRYHSSTNGLTETATSSEWGQGEGITATKTTKAGAAEYSYSETLSEDLSDSISGSIMYEIKVETNVTGEAAESIKAHTYYLIIHVEADQNAKLNSLKIIQKGSTAKFEKTILANSFDKGETPSDNFSASLNLTGDIVITPYKYAKAKIEKVVLECDGVEVTSANADGIKFATDGSITIPYSVYSKKLGSTYTVSYEVRAQDASVEHKTYTASFMIPEYKTIKETETKKVYEERTFVIPTGVTAGLGYRFGSKIADKALGVKDHFGGIDIIGSDGTSWYESSFGGSGFQFVLNIDNKDYWVELDDNGNLKQLYTYDGGTPAAVATPEGIGFKVKPTFVLEEGTQYLELEFLVTNTAGSSVKLGAAIDTLIGTFDESTNADNDKVSVVSTNNGFDMKGKEFTFSMLLQNAYGVDNVDRFWYGSYDSGKFLLNVFKNNSNGFSKGADSAASFYWTLGSEKSSSRKIRITMRKNTAAGASN